MSGRPRTSRARRISGSWRAASPRGGACSTSARRSSMPAPVSAALAAAVTPAVDAAWPDGAGSATAAMVRYERRRQPSRAEPGPLANAGSWILGGATGLTGREAGGCEARSRLSRAGRRTETVPRPRPMRHRFVESIIHEAFPSALARPPIRPVTSSSPPASTIAWTDPARADAFFAWLGRVGPQHAVVASTLRPASSQRAFAPLSRRSRRRRQRHRHGCASAAGRRRAVRPRRRPDLGRRPARPARPRRRHPARLSPPPRRSRQRALPPCAAGGAGEAATFAAPTA